MNPLERTYSIMMSQDSEQLAHRRQFILGPYPLAEFSHWRTRLLGNRLVLQVHDDLPLVHVAHKGLRLTLLGFALDPLAPEHDDETILRELAARCPNARQAPRLASELTGRWVMIVEDGNDLILFHDPCGLREVYHTAPDAIDTWCASQPHLLAEHLRLNVGQAQRQFMRTSYFRENDDAWLPSPATAWDELSHLTPNHSLNLKTRSVDRYWPNKPLRYVEFEEGAHLAAQLLRQTVRAAHRRFPLALPVTAGMDSRTLLAATRGLDDIWHYTGVWGVGQRVGADAKVAEQVLERVRHEHHVVRCPDKLSKGFWKTYLRNTYAARPRFATAAENMWREFPEGRVQLSGHCSEIVRDTFRVTHLNQVDAPKLGSMMRMLGAPHAMAQIEQWLERTRPVAERTGYRLWDLFFMEQEYGVWAANQQSQWDLIHDRVTPFNHRGLLSALMGVDPVHRQPPEFAAHLRMMEILWAEVLQEPFDQPISRLQRFSRGARKTLQESGLSGAFSAGVQRFVGGPVKVVPGR